MKTNELYSHIWLSRMWGKDKEIGEDVALRDKLNEWGVGVYDANHIPNKTDSNTSESKFIEYTILSAEIDKQIEEYLREIQRTDTVIRKVDNALFRGILKAWYINRKSWKEIGKEYHYEKTQVYEIRNKALSAVYPFIPEGEVNLDEY